MAHFYTSLPPPAIPSDLNAGSICGHMSSGSSPPVNTSQRNSCGRQGSMRGEFQFSRDNSSPLEMYSQLPHSGD